MCMWPPGTLNAGTWSAIQWKRVWRPSVEPGSLDTIESVSAKRGARSSSEDLQSEQSREDKQFSFYLCSFFKKGGGTSYTGTETVLQIKVKGYKTKRMMFVN